MPPKHIPIILKAGPDKPLPSLPSPTLTNPDFILPDCIPAFPTPPRIVARPPSLSYLADEAQVPLHNGFSNNALGQYPRGLGLRLSGNSAEMDALSPQSHTTPSEQGQEGSEIPPSLLLRPPSSREKLWERYNEERTSSALSSVRSEELDNIPDVVGYGDDGDGSDVETLDGNDFVVRSPDELAYDAVGGQEQSSAMLSRRAELVLANAKKKLLVS